MSHKITVKQSFSNFCQENFNETNHIKWTYEEIDKYFTKLQLHFYDDQVVEYNAVSGTHIWFWNLIEVDEELLTDENKYISIARKNDGHTNIVTQDDVKVETYKTNIYANVPYGTQNRKHLYEIGNLDIIEKPQFVAEYQKQQASAILIQNAWIDAIVNPNCVLGINRINKDFDDMQSGTL
jgi:hypothetical protein